ncbi:sigma factor-like helix-turn-helix DNA-binding protein [Nocardioides ferulae]|uniref:sigma factor-like helix-turn-helix DNA-binding protein n=1 Tax=Nocardioides ferulae TaxID=2340821 RepID=UPI0019807ED2|nr:sigma factor-like helix-turn-helix DNA-binding protein [Nocardioides ferulae]
MTVAVLTVDQRRSRTEPDRVPQMIDRMAGVPLDRPLQRTVGDEFQAVLTDPASLPLVLEPLLRDGGWHVGLGFGEVERPLPDSTRAGRGPAFVAAREAVTAAKNSPWHLRLAGDRPGVRPLESAIWLWAAVLARRTKNGWEVADLVDEGLTYEEAGRRLGISQSAVSQRAQAAGIVEGRRARELVGYLAGQLLDEADR